MTATYLITRRVLREQPTAVVRATVDLAKVVHWLPEAYRVIEEFLSDKRVAACGRPFARYMFVGDKAMVEAGFPVPVPVAGDGYVVPASLPAGPVVVAVHCDGGDLAGAHRAVQDWIKLHGYGLAGPTWEIYLTDPTEPPDRAAWRAEVVAPYRRRADDRLA